MRLAPCLAVVLLCPIAALAQPAQPRGALLYETHCGACHTTQVHWRERRLVTDWASLSHQVWRWQDNANLSWSPADVDAVARYLNARFYRMPEPAGADAGSGPRAPRRG